MSYLPHTNKDIQAMLTALGKKSTDEIFSHIPKELIEKEEFLSHKPLSEYEVLSKIKEYALKNKPLSEHNSFLGAGCYQGYVPSIVNHIASRSEFYTAYTPYQPEVSQGILQSIYEYQSFICLLTGMQATSASLYDGASALSEAILMGLRKNKKKEVLMCASVHPDYQTVASTYLEPLSITPKIVPFNSSGECNIDDLKKNLTENVSSLVIQVPNFFGILQDIETISHLCKEHNVLLILTTTNPLFLGLFEISPERIDIICGDGRTLGGTPYWGGDTFGFIATKDSLLRNLPGRIVGKTTDKNNNECFVLTLQAREQHIRRERATSNICSNQALNALKAAVYLSTIGEEGLKKVSSKNFYNTHYLISKIKEQLPQEIEIVFSQRVFNEFVIRPTQKKADDVIRLCQEKGIIAGLSLERYYKELKNCILVCATETKSKKDLDSFIDALKKIL